MLTIINNLHHTFSTTFSLLNTATGSEGMSDKCVMKFHCCVLLPRALSISLINYMRFAQILTCVRVVFDESSNEQKWALKAFTNKLHLDCQPAAKLHAALTTTTNCSFDNRTKRSIQTESVYALRTIRIRYCT